MVSHRTIRRIFRMRLADDFNPRVARYDRNKLGTLFRELGYKKGAEIGVRLGQYSKVLCEKNPGVEHYAIDMWSGRTNAKRKKEERIKKEAIKRLSPYNVTIIHRSSLDALSMFKDKSLDYVYIDANHTFDHCCPDIIYWSQKVRSGGIVGVHDYCYLRKYGVIPAVNAYTNCHNITPWYVTRETIPTAFWVNP